MKRGRQPAATGHRLPRPSRRAPGTPLPAGETARNAFRGSADFGRRQGGRSRNITSARDDPDARGGL